MSVVQKPTLSLIVPAFNEEKNIVPLLMRVAEVVTTESYEVIFIDDGSSDNTLSVLQNESKKNPLVKYLSFSRNFGKDNALLCGFQHASGDAVITLDADLQHPPDIIPQLVAKWREGYDVVYTFRADKNEHANWAQQLSSRFFYRTLNFLSDMELEDGISDFRLLDKKVMNQLKQFPEYNPFFRGLIKWVGFRQTGIPYTPHKRHAGTTKYSTTALFRLALQSISSFSIKPLYLAVYLGLIFSVLSILVYVPYIVYSLYNELAISGWASLIATIIFFGGLQLVIMGIIGIYLGKLFMQSKQRPPYILQETSFTA